MAIKQDGIIPIPGVPYGMRWESHYWALYQSKVVKSKDGRRTKVWTDPLYPVDFAHMAHIITRDVGAEATTAQEFVSALIRERERLEAVMAGIVAAVGSSTQEQGTLF